MRVYLGLQRLKLRFFPQLLLIFHIDYNDYNEGGKYISYLLTPATVCLAVPLYEQFELLKKNVRAVIAGIVSGVITSVSCVLIMALIFHLTQAIHTAVTETSGI